MQHERNKFVLICDQNYVENLSDIKIFCDTKYRNICNTQGIAIYLDLTLLHIKIEFRRKGLLFTGVHYALVASHNKQPYEKNGDPLQIIEWNATE